MIFKRYFSLKGAWVGYLGNVIFFSLIFTCLIYVAIFLFFSIILIFLIEESDLKWDIKLKFDLDSVSPMLGEDYFSCLRKERH